MQRAIVMVVAGLGLVGGLGPARANMAAPPRPAEVSGPGVPAPSPLVVRAADLVIDCTAGADACTLEVTYQLDNPTDALAGGVAAFYALDTEDVRVTVGGELAPRTLTADDIAGFDRAVTATSGATPEDLVVPRRDDLTRHGLGLAIAPGASTEVKVTGVITPRERRRHYMAMPAAAARHRLLVRGSRNHRRVRIEYLVAPIRTWGGFPAEMTFTLRHPTGWAADVAGATGLVAERSGGVTVHRGRISTGESLLKLELDVAPQEPIHAGLLLAVGGHVDDATGVRVRAGVEAARGSMLASMAVELERGDETGVVLVPAFTVASPWIIIVPSIGLGVGVPIRLRPELEVGGRFLVDAHVGPLGIVLALDYYPGMAADPRRFSTALLGQLSL